MTEFNITGYEILAGTRILLPVDIASVEPGISVPVTGTVNVGSVNAIIDVATLNAVIDVATIQMLGTIQNAPLVTVQGTVTSTTAVIGTIQAVGTIESAPLITVQGSVTVATIDNAPLVTIQGSSSASIEYPVIVSTIENAPLITVQGSVSVATIENAPLVTVEGALSASVEYPVVVSTIESAPLVTVAGTLEVGTIFNQPQVTVLDTYKQTAVLTNQTVIASSAATLVAQSLQDVVVDVVYGTVVAGSILTAIVGVEPQSGVQTSTITAGSWFAGTVPTGQRLVAAGPLGDEIAVVWSAPSASILNVFITAEQSTGN